eukprot:CAMPEP_0168615294 /NCGR_PEP_ID=MMETSP0449_2-20121227/4429_1 /TAXON_ID=1082188 /ORGANISM="Strombidium rassoulzadegani, Strain ras09" /LENGTH=81 /DNA_ID=CAMNT_0008656027 /DNA_START=415 /DNA_END=661 /DNA_ORIENTATION=-
MTSLTILDLEDELGQSLSAPGNLEVEEEEEAFDFAILSQVPRFDATSGANMECLSTWGGKMVEARYLIREQKSPIMLLPLT